jgi:transcriptional regulator with XRE-family HTH domain
MKTSYSERNYEYGTTMMTLRTAIGLTQAELANVLGVSRLTVAKWEAGINYPKTEHLKKLITLGVESQTFPKGSEPAEIRALWKAAHQKAQLDEYWLSALLSQGSCTDPDVGQELDGGKSDLTVAPMSVENWESGPDQGVEAIPCGGQDQSLSGPRSGQDSTVLSPLDARSVETTSPALSLPNGQLSEDNRSNNTRGRRKWLLPIIIALVVLTIIGSTGTLFFLTRNGAATQKDKTNSGYLPEHGTLAFFDPLSQERGSQWKSDGDTCQFVGGAYHVSRLRLDGYYTNCEAYGMFSNFVFEIQLTITQGDCGGMMFRDEGGGHFYQFTLCQDGGYQGNKYVDHQGPDAKRLLSSRSSAIHTGLGQQNTIAIVASGSMMSLYANEHKIAQMQDSSYTSGIIALIADPTADHATEVVYSNARLWTL